MKLFRREPGDRSPAAADHSGYRPKETDAFEFRRPALERSDEATIANLISLFREGDQTPGPNEAEVLEDIEMPNIDMDDPEAPIPAAAATEEEEDAGTLWKEEPEVEPEARIEPEAEAELEAEVAPAPAEARVRTENGAVNRLRARLAEPVESDWADPALVAPKPQPEPAVEAEEAPQAEMPDLSAPLLLKDEAPLEDFARPATLAEAETAEDAGPLVDVPMAAAARPARRGGRVKTRLLGFEQSHATADPFAKAREESTVEQTAEARFPVGWIVVLKGPGRGASFTLFSGVSQIGRGEDQTVRLDFGDTSISRQGHAVVAYDPEQRKHFLGHGGKANIVRLNNMPVLSTEELRHGDLIRLGETTLRFVALCGENFDWDADEEAAGDEFAAQ